MSISRPQEGLSFDPEKTAETEKTESNQSSDGSDDVNSETQTQVVDWDSPNDPQNPMNWSPTRKWATIALVSTITFNTAMTSTVFAPGVPLLMKEFHSDSDIIASFTVSIYLIGFSFGPLFLSPLSELYGRSPIMHASNLLFLVFSVACANSVNLPMLVVFRLLLGFAGCPPLTLGGGTIADLQPPEKRGLALSLWTMGPLLGPVLGLLRSCSSISTKSANKVLEGPVIGGCLAQALGWRWIFGLITILTGITTIAAFLFLRETYGPSILKQKAKRLSKNPGLENSKSKFDDGKSASQLFKLAIIRPTRMLLFLPIVSLLSIYMAIVYSYLYLLFTTFTAVFEDLYGFSTLQAGLAYLGLGVGFLVGQIGVGAFSDKYLKSKASSGGGFKPEHRLPPLLIGTFLVPAGLFWYGWSAEYHTHWLVPIVGTSLIGVGTLFAFLPIQMYLVDSYGIFAVSAVATNAFLRSLVGAVIPLAGGSLYARLGLGWGNTLLAFIALAFSPLPFFLIRYGERLRTHPRFQIVL